jgi:hypothetical protein
MGAYRAVCPIGVCGSPGPKLRRAVSLSRVASPWGGNRVGWGDDGSDQAPADRGRVPPDPGSFGEGWPEPREEVPVGAEDRSAGSADPSGFHPSGSTRVASGSGGDEDGFGRP